LVGPVEVGPIAHGGHCVARHEGRVIFVRHTIPGERVMVRITDAGKARFWRGDAVEILEPSPDRVQPPCPIARPGGCGGCDFQHIGLDAQRRLKADVLAEQLRRLAGIDLVVPVEPVPLPVPLPGSLPGSPSESGAADGLGWRSRMRYLLDGEGRPGLRAHRSHTVIPLPDGGCRIAAPAIAEPAAGAPGTELLGIAAADGVHWLGRSVTETAEGEDALAIGEARVRRPLTSSGRGSRCGTSAERGTRTELVEGRFPYAPGTGQSS
jgi:predicted RNA-binding protein with TRAM domain